MSGDQVSIFMYLFSFLTILLFLFFSSRRRHTRFSRDWSSDVCSSDLIIPIESIRMKPNLVALPQVCASSLHEPDLKFDSIRFYCSRLLLSIQAVFSCTSSLCVRMSAVG